MTILQKTTSAQDLKFIPRSKTYDTLLVKDESANTETTVTIASSTSNDYFETISAVFDLKENRFYRVLVKNGTSIVYYGRIFCTNQNNDTYSVNNNEYTQHDTGANDFIIYE
tara:strand:+ start:156 stop:491 length:336 start_codon:yes stop_codon:yes gene_type:complete